MKANYFVLINCKKSNKIKLKNRNREEIEAKIDPNFCVQDLNLPLKFVATVYGLKDVIRKYFFWTKEIIYDYILLTRYIEEKVLDQILEKITYEATLNALELSYKTKQVKLWEYNLAIEEKDIFLIKIYPLNLDIEDIKVESKEFQIKYLFKDSKKFYLGIQTSDIKESVNYLREKIILRGTLTHQLDIVYQKEDPIFWKSGKPVDRCPECLGRLTSHNNDNLIYKERTCLECGAVIEDD